MVIQTLCRSSQQLTRVDYSLKNILQKGGGSEYGLIISCTFISLTEILYIIYKIEDIGYDVSL